MSRAPGAENGRTGRSPSRAEQNNHDEDSGGVGEVLQNRPFLLLWTAQLATQIGGNMVLYGLAIIISARYSSATAVSALLLSFLVPAVIFSAIAGVYVDQVDRRLMLVATNILRGIAFAGVFLAGNNLLLIYPLVVFVSTVTTFFGPAEASMIPILVPRQQLLAANGLFTLTMNAAFAAGFALFGPFVVSLSSPQILIIVVAILYFVAAGLCWTLPPAPPVAEGLTAGRAVADAERAVETMFGQLGEGIDYIRKNRSISWSLTYLGVAASLIGVLGVIGPGFAQKTLGLSDKGFVVVVLPLGLGIVTGILALNSYGKYLPRRRLIESGLITLGALLVVLSIVGPLSEFLQGQVAPNAPQELSRALSVLGIVIAVGFVAGIAYIFVAVPSQTQLQEDIPEAVRGRIFGILSMLVSIASFLPIIVVAPIADVIGNPPVIFVVAVLVLASGVASVVTRGPLDVIERETYTTSGSAAAPVDPITAVMSGGEIATHTSYVRGPAARPGLAPHGEPVTAGRAEPGEERAEARPATPADHALDDVPSPQARVDAMSPKQSPVEAVSPQQTPVERAPGQAERVEAPSGQAVPGGQAYGQPAAGEQVPSHPAQDDQARATQVGAGEPVAATNRAGQTSWLDQTGEPPTTAGADGRPADGRPADERPADVVSGPLAPLPAARGQGTPGSGAPVQGAPVQGAPGQRHRRRIRGVIRRSPLDPDPFEKSLLERVAGFPRSLFRRLRGRDEDD